MKCAVKIFLFLLAPAQISVPVDVKSKTGTGKMLCFIHGKGLIRLRFQLTRKAVQRKV